NRVGRGDDVPMADVKVARGVRVHRQEVVTVAGRPEVGLVQPQLVPLRLPARLDLGGLVALDAGSRRRGRHFSCPINKSPPADSGKGFNGHPPKRVATRSPSSEAELREAIGARSLVELRGFEPLTF